MCTGPGVPLRAPVAAVSTRASSNRQDRGVAGVSSIWVSARTCRANSPAWSVVWFPPAWRTARGRSAVNAISGIRL